MKINKIDLILKIFFLSALIFFIIVTLPFIELSVFWLIPFLVLYSCVLFVFMSLIKKVGLKIFRHYLGIRATSKGNLDKEFHKHGGIVGYQPVKDRHVALVFISDSSKNYSDISYDEISPLIEDFKKNKVNYKLYFCYLTDDFVKIIKSKYIYGIHIFGHGAIDSLGFEDGIVQYREFKGIEPKDFIAQWHCNHGEGKSLGELIGRKYYVPYGYTIIKQNKKEIIELINNPEKWTINQNL
jgi:hypothetical protein